MATAKEIVRKILDDVGIPSDVDFELRGLPADETFTISFKENRGSACSHVKKVIDGQRLDKTKWRRYEVKTTQRLESGDFEMCYLFINPDKNGRMVRTEVSMRNIIGLLKPDYGDKFVYLSKPDGIVGIRDGKKLFSLCRIVVASAASVEASVEALWKPCGGSAADRFGIDHKKISKQFEESDGLGANVEWTRS